MLQDASRAEELYVPPMNLNTDYDSMYDKIEENYYDRFSA